MIIKSPVCYDTSHWKRIPDWALVKPRPVLVFTKASESYPGTPFNNITDPTFAPYFRDLKQDGIARGAFHFHRKAYDATRQARHFISVVGPELTEKDYLALDLEEGGETAAQIITWLDVVQNAFPHNLIFIYSRKNILDPIPMTEVQKIRMRRQPVWTAGYPYFPDLWNTVPGGQWGYIPDQSKYGPVLLWQYTESAKIEGIEGAVDCNWIEPSFYERIKRDMEPQPDPDPIGDTMQGRIKTFTNIRDIPGNLTDEHDIGDLLTGDTVIWDRGQLSGSAMWYHLTDAMRGSQPVRTSDGRAVSARGDCWCYAVNVEPIQPDPIPDPSLPAYFTAHDAAGKELARYNKQ